ncbi:MAG: hypothetical protein J6B64_03115 [Bacilli bacterium]|nr:hypothetical protein [Bacilli bacterium]MBO5376372.1 hypothetical protein [Bacilli bacterium]MBP3597623.1 hypothetical protein [Clostridia bacterium]
MGQRLCDLNLKEFRKNYDYGDLCMLDYLKRFLSKEMSADLHELYNMVYDYNEIYANGWTIENLLDLGMDDPYWNYRAKNFIKKYNIPKTDYSEYSKYFEKYNELKTRLLDEFGIEDKYLDFNVSIDDIPEEGFYEFETITKPQDIQEDYSYTVARVRNFGHCVELHYYNGNATIEYGDKITNDYWENVVDSADWFNKNMTEEEILNKLDELFKEYYGVKYEREL